ncbi:hypothetical protein Dsin_030782 [Dipteronia sinensis]|uniref:Cation efflux protein transmembrane domain-containing protein n=1 Tax=Dipteronia sinensis TaxID=43782 RepID=A0AAE0DRE9_9ROSI|nr:hypothetical protein Dsin_030782 [Dipteronia sinensis]
MADHHHHHLHRPHRISVPPRSAATTTTTTTAINPTPTTSRYPPYLYPSSTPTPTTSKSNQRALSLSNSKSNRSSVSSLFVILFSLRSLYSLLPFLRSSPSFSLFPFSFLVSFLSLVLSLSFSLLSFPSSKHRFSPKLHQPIFSFSQISQSQNKFLLCRSFLLACVFLLRFQALRYCGTSAMILAELSGNVAARFLSEYRKNRSFSDRSKSSEVRGFLCLFIGLFLLSISWDRIECFPLSSSVVGKWGLSVVGRENCVRVWPMLLPFLSGFLGCYERVSMNWGTIKQLGRKQVRMISLFYTTVLLFIPSVVSVIMLEHDGDSVSIVNLWWPLANTVVFGVLLTENYSDDKLVSSMDFRREFLVTFVCTIILELFYYPELSLWGLLLCGLLLYISVRELDPVHSNYELGFESSESFITLIMKPIHHILSERKSRKIALFLLINTGYMVVEFVAGFMSNSLGLISDACHMLFDCAALAIGLYASYISRLPANNQFNYGRGRFEVLSGYVNAVFLVLVGALIVLESLERILDPQEISTNSLLTVSIGGLLVNVVGLIFFHEEHHHAHGGSCSHSHSHPHPHSHSHHDHQHSHDHESHGKSFSVNCDDHDSHSHSHHDHQHSHDHESHGKSCSANCDDHDRHSHSHHNHQHSHDHESHGKSCSANCDDHESAHATHHHDHHSHAHEHDQHGHGQEHDHHGRSHEHDHCDHHHHADNHGHENMPSSSSRSLNVRSNEEARKRHNHIDHNMEGIFLHVLADTMGSVGVVISTLLIKYKGWLVADPACSIFISVMIVASVIPLLRNSAEILLQRVPRAHEMDLREALNDVTNIKGVHGFQNLHIWSFTNSDVVGTLHLHVSTEVDKASVKTQVSHILHDAGIKDLTLQVECVK